jgi:protein-S-isoprenylcysteine O-methyltransferase Ste14
MNDNIWMVVASFIGCNLTLTVGHFIELRSSNPNMLVASVGMLLSIALIPFYVAAIISLGKNLTVLPEANELNTRGIYSISRHPLYSCNIYWFFTNILIYQSKVIMFTSIVQAIFQIIRAKNEEKILEKNFPEYDDYKKKVWWIGRIKEKQLKADTRIN